MRYEECAAIVLVSSLYAVRAMSSNRVGQFPSCLRSSPVRKFSHLFSINFLLSMDLLLLIAAANQLSFSAYLSCVPLVKLLCQARLSVSVRVPEMWHAVMVTHTF